MEAATAALRAAARWLLQEGKVDPQLLILAAARVTGELGASAALADGMDPEAILSDLADFVRHAGREHTKALHAGALPVGRERLSAPRTSRRGLVARRGWLRGQPEGDQG